MLYGKYSFACELESTAKLPFYKGSALRGVFGRALKKTVCALRQQQCDACLLNTRCLYAAVFETPVTSRSSDTPHPFVLEPPLIPETEFPAGAPFDFSLLLFGEANKSLPYFVYAVDQMGRLGIGARQNGMRGRFRLASVKHGRKTIYDVERKKLLLPPALETLAPTPHPSDNKVKTLTLAIETPLRMKTQNRLTAGLPFHVLVRGMLRRVSSLMKYYAEGEPPLDYKGLVQRAMDIQATANNLQWFDWRRYSFRQDNEMLMGGITGSVTYEGELNEFMPLVRFCEKAHVGKQTSFGLGKIKTG